MKTTRFAGNYFRLIFLVLIPTTSDFAQTQIVGGTVIILAHNQHRGVFAADSRAVIQSARDLKPRVNDSYCKFSTAQNRFIFASYVTDGNENWSSSQTAKNISNDVITRSRKITPGTLDRIVTNWRASTKTWLSMIGAAGMKQIQSMTHSSDLVGGVFALRLDDHTIDYREAKFSTSGMTHVHSQIASYSHPLEVVAAGYTTPFSGFGALDIFQMFTADFIGEKPEFVTDEVNQWRRMPTDGLEAYQVKRIVELTIEHTTHNETVGGHVNSVEITSNGIAWRTDNPECKDH